ncbi:DUF975 family protein [uncultured Clostridium sp.]|uniref:DUF975 family protein n=1 Tax=uncultured Clostridium sp. TaxID=59620 RepID=UPI0025D4B6B5|nr:DUF975 family protein [uncultured Clostridium sp.]
MWSIGDMKRNGWAKVKLYYWSAFAVTIIWSLLGGGASRGGSVNTYREYREDIHHSFQGINPATLHMIIFTLLGIFAIVGIAALLFKVFIGNPVTVGKNRFFMESRLTLKSAGIGKVFWVFGCGHYMNVVKIMFLRDLFTGLWSLLFIIPGIYKGYEYAMIPYILSENPEADSRDVFAVTKDMMNGNRFQMFLLELSFIGWYLLGALLCCVGGVLVVPYQEAAIAELYHHLRGYINGFPFNGYGVPEPEVFYDNQGGGDNYYDNQNQGGQNYGNGNYQDNQNQDNGNYYDNQY